MYGKNTTVDRQVGNTYTNHLDQPFLMNLLQLYTSYTIQTNDKMVPRGIVLKPLQAEDT